MTRHYALIALALSTLVGCHRGAPESGAATAPPPELDDERHEPDAPTRGDTKEYSAPGLRVLDKRPVVGPPPRVQIVRPKNQALIAHGPIMAKLLVTGWKLAPAPGNHVHVKIDDSKEFAVRDVSKAFALDERYEKETGEPLSEGTHILRVFLSRPNHESVKVPSAFDSIVFHHRSRTAGWSFDRDRPMLTYSRPQGCASDPDRLLDFVVTNINGLSRKGYRVQYVIDGVHFGTLFSWTPYQIRDLSQGKHAIRLTLLRPDNSPAPGRFNDVTTSFEVSDSCPWLGLIPEDTHSEDEEVLE
jgi:hypothetical protein